MVAPGAGGAPAVVADLRAELDADVHRIEEESGELDMLMEQVLIEVERHAARRAKVESQLAALESSTAPDHAQIAEVRDSLLALTRREMLFDAQRQVLEGKQRVLARFVQRLVEIDDHLASWGGLPLRPAPLASPGLRPLALAAAGRTAPSLDQPVLVLRSQEELRRDIVQKLHDGPAQSIANIGLQAEIVERLMAKGDARARDEVEALRRLVQQALDTTKQFIFEIRPMVLDDLGLAPTLRRAASDRGRRSGVTVDFSSQGIEERLDPEIFESAVFRSVDEAIAGYVALSPPSVVARLDWSERELVATVAGTWPRVKPDPEPASGGAAQRPDEIPPALLAMMEEKRTEAREARTAARSLAPERVAEIEHRARVLGMVFTIRDEGQAIELVAPMRRRTQPGRA